jgi:hypothetical protein
MDRLFAAAELTELQRERMTLAAESDAGLRFSVTPRVRPAEAQTAFAARCLASRMSRGAIVSTLQEQFGICRTSAYSRVRKGLDSMQSEAL